MRIIYFEGNCGPSSNTFQAIVSHWQAKLPLQWARVAYQMTHFRLLETGCHAAFIWLAKLSTELHTSGLPCTAVVES